MGAETGGYNAPGIDNTLLFGSPICPYCEADAGCHCEKCQTLFCLSKAASGIITCPRCGHSGPLGHGRYDIRQSQG